MARCHRPLFGEPGGAHMLSVGYLALTRGAGDELLGSHWSPWYSYFPWEDWREGKPDILTDEIEPRLKEWAARPPLPDEPARPLRRQERREEGPEFVGNQRRGHPSS